MLAGRLSHAHLFAGPEGVGKRQIAEDIVRVLVPQEHVFDVMRLAPERDAETGVVHDIPIEQTKALKAWIVLRPVGAHKAVIIEGAERLGQEAANNLLKVLEEPPAYAHFFLITTQPGQILPTIASRCERVDFLPVPGQSLPPLTKAARDLAEAVKASVSAKILYAKNFAESEDAGETVTLLLRHIHAQLAAKPHLAPLAHGLLDLAQVLTQPQYNRRLAIEHVLLSL